jgi:hypothetical protein
MIDVISSSPRMLGLTAFAISTTSSSKKYKPGIAKSDFGRSGFSSIDRTSPSGLNSIIP